MSFITSCVSQKWITPIGAGFALDRRVLGAGWELFSWPMTESQLTSIASECTSSCLLNFYHGRWARGECCEDAAWGVALVRDLGPCIAAKVLLRAVTLEEALLHHDYIQGLIVANGPVPLPKRLSEDSAARATLALADERKRGRA